MIGKKENTWLGEGKDKTPYSSLLYRSNYLEEIASCLTKIIRFFQVFLESRQDLLCMTRRKKIQGFGEGKDETPYS